MHHFFRAMTALLIFWLFPLAAMAQDLRLEDFFAGQTRATGTISALNGARGFRVTMTGTWANDALLLQIDRVYDDGVREQQVCRVSRIEAGRYVGTCDNRRGKTYVTIKGATARFTYEAALDPSPDATRVRFHNRMTLMPDGTVVNKARITRYGLPIGRSQVLFSKGR